MDRNSKEITLAKLNSRIIIWKAIPQTQTLNAFTIKEHNILFNLIKKP